MDRIIKYIIILILLLLFPVKSWTAIYHIKQTASGDQSGDSETNADSVAEFNADNINDGAVGMAPGDTIYFYDTITSMIVPPVSGTDLGGNITLDGYDTDDTTHMLESGKTGEVAGRAKIDMTQETKGIEISGKNYITIQDFEIYDCEKAIDIIGSSDYITVMRTYMHLIARNGVYIGDGSDYVTIGGTAGHGNVIKDCGTGTADSDIVTVTADHLIISYNHLYAEANDRGTDGINLHSSEFVLIEYNSIHDHNDSDGVTGENGIDLKHQTQDVIIRFNKIYNHTYESGIIFNGRFTDPGEDSADRIYIYGNLFTGGDNGIAMQNNVSTSYDDVYIFSNLFYEMGNNAIIVAEHGGYNIFNNVFAETEQNANDSQDSGIWINGTGTVVKNNIFYKNCPNYSTYLQICVTNSLDTNATVDYNWYYWPNKLSKVRWGDAGDIDINTLQDAGVTTNGRPQEQGLLANEDDPGLISLAGNDYRISASDSAVAGQGVDMGSDEIATVTIQGTPYDVDWDVALGSATDWSGIIPVIEVLNRDDFSAWDIGAYQYNLAITNPYPVGSGVPITADLTWDNPTGTVTVDVYYDQDEGSCPPAVPTKVVPAENVETYVIPGDIGYSKKCCWRVDVNYIGGTETGDNLEFTTQGFPPSRSGGLYEPGGMKVIQK